MTIPEARRLAKLLDPAASHIAAEDAVHSGRVASNKEAVLAALREHCGFTAGELADVAGMPVVEVRRRLSDLRNAGVAWQGDYRDCSVEGTQQHEWFTDSEYQQGSLPV